MYGTTDMQSNSHSMRLQQLAVLTSQEDAAWLTYISSWLVHQDEEVHYTKTATFNECLPLIRCPRGNRHCNISNALHSNIRLRSIVSYISHQAYFTVICDLIWTQFDKSITCVFGPYIWLWDQGQDTRRVTEKLLACERREMFTNLEHDILTQTLASLWPQESRIEVDLMSVLQTAVTTPAMTTSVITHLPRIACLLEASILGNP